MHIVELSTAIVAVDTKVTNASLTQNQRLQCVTPPLTHVEIPQLRNATELNNDGISKLHGRRLVVYYQTEPNFLNFSERDLIDDDSSFCSFILSATDLQCHVFPFAKLVLNVCLCL